MVGYLLRQTSYIIDSNKGFFERWFGDIIFKYELFI